MAKGAMDIFLVYQFIRRLVTPFEKWDAFEKGVIDKEGKVLVKKGDRTSEQEQSWGYYERLVANLKKLLGKVPGGKTKLASFAAALLLIKENNIDPDDMVYLEEILPRYLDEAKYIIEDNIVGGGAVAGLGVGDDGEPPGITNSEKKKKK